MTNIILSGGSGTRLWPLSRKMMPKQFLRLFDNRSLFQLTIERNSKVCDKSLVITNEEQYFLALDQLEEINNSTFNIQNTTFILEEIGKNTAPAITFAALECDGDEILFVTPSDHLIKNEEKYFEAVQKAKKLAQQGYLVTFGIKPTKPHTGYGYIQAKPENDELEIMNVELFHEKPNLETATKYLEENSKLNIQNLPLKFFWNSGMFMFKAGIFLDELKKYATKVYEEVLKSYEKRQTVSNNQIRLKEMQDIPEISVDYAVMEKSKNIKLIPSEFEWNDVGSFDSLIDEIESIEL